MSSIKGKKSLGQHFIADMRVPNFMVSQIIGNEKIVIEIGPGTGALTTKLLDNHNIKRLIAIEIDKDMIDILYHKFDDHIKSGRFVIILGDAVDMKIESICNEKVSIVGNLPYCSGSKILMNCIKQINNIEQIIVLLQNEVVDRIVAKCNTNAYSRISVLIQAICMVKKVMKVKPGAFVMRPSVNSAVVNIIPNNILNNDLWLKLEIFVNACFKYRRKTTLNAIDFANIPIDMEGFKKDYYSIGYQDMTRPGEINIRDFVFLSKHISL